ncbi:MAG: hypothetical protein NTW19_01960 [Planctomycetota bacterium]|nr:hypothetical protein [Planctomycetota bacterium]
MIQSLSDCFHLRHSMSPQSSGQFFVSAGCLGVKTDTLVHGPSFPLWFRAATNYMQSLQVSGHADAVFPLEGELRRFMGEAASIAFPSVDDRGIQRREWTLHPVGSTVMARSAAAIIELVVDLEEVKAVPPSLADQVRALTIPLEIQGKGWQEAKRFRWSYLSAFPPMLWLLEAASGRIGEQGAAPRSAGQVGGRTGRLPAVELLGPDEPPRLYGLLLGAPLSRKRYKLIQAMLAAPADGMTKKEIQEDHPSALEMITKLRMSHPLWEMALLMPEKGGNHYRIADVW